LPIITPGALSAAQYAGQIEQKKSNYIDKPFALLP
jgi:hypothetical protein